MPDSIDGRSYDNAEEADFKEGKRVKVPSEYPLKITREEMAGRSVYLYNGAGAFLGSIEINKPGNKQYDSEFFHTADQTYTYTLPSGYEVLLSVPQDNEPPFLFTVGKNELADFYSNREGEEQTIPEKQCKLMVEADGSINIRDLESPYCTEAELAVIVEPEDQGEMITRVERSNQIPKEWMDISLREDQAMYIHTGDLLSPKAIIYKIPNLWYGYMVRETGSDKLYPLDGLGTDNDFYTFSYSGGLTLQMRQYDGILEIRADGLLFCDKIAGKCGEHVSAGEDGHFSGKINGGRPIAGFTAKSAGGPELSKYGNVNEDNYCVNYVNGRVVVADGIGGQLHGQHASALCTRWIAHSQYSLRDSIYNAQTALQVMGAGIKRNQPDTVFAAVELKGDYAETAHTGDCAIVHVKEVVGRNGKKEYQVFKSRNHTVLASMIEDKDVTEREAYTDFKYALQEASVTTTLLSARIRHELLGGVEVDQVEYGSLILNSGDFLILMSDGAKVLTDEEIIGAVKAGNPEDAAFSLKEIIRCKNEMGEYPRDFKDGKPPVNVRSAFDNVTVVVIRHD